jgi:hypothetical protein
MEEERSRKNCTDIRPDLHQENEMLAVSKEFLIESDLFSIMTEGLSGNRRKCGCRTRMSGLSGSEIAAFIPAPAYRQALGAAFCSIFVKTWMRTS